MKYQLANRAWAGLVAFVAFGALVSGCSSEPKTTASHDEMPTTVADEEPFDPHHPGAALLCDRPDVPEGTEGKTMYFVVSAMNFKLEQYPDFAAAIGVDLVSDCDSAFRYEAGLALYSGEHPGFDADEPLAPGPVDVGDDVPPAPAEAVNPDQAQVQKIFGGNDAIDNSVVGLEFETCTKSRPNGARCPDADSSWKVNGVDLRRAPFHCTGTFIAKNWILTAAHCATFSAIDQCMEKGTPRSACKPNWDHYARWRVKGTLSTDHGPDGVPSNDDTRRDYDFLVQARTYVIQNWGGRDLTVNPETCEGCANQSSFTDDDLALLYVSTTDDPNLPPRTDDDAAKRVSTIPPDLSWSMSLEGYGRPAAFTVLRNVNGPWPFQKSDQQLFVVGEPSRYVCPGDSGGPLTRNDILLDTADGQRKVDTIIGVIAASTAKCDGTPEKNPTQSFNITRIDTERHLNFIRDSMKRWPATQSFSCINKGPVVPGNIQPLEMMECWGAPCQNDDACKKTESCWYPSEDVETMPLTCNCSGFASPLDQGCNCVVGQCLPD